MSGKKHLHKIFEFLEQDNEEAIQRLIDEDKAEQFSADECLAEFQEDLENDLNILRDLSQRWESMRRDPKLLKFLEIRHAQDLLESKIKSSSLPNPWTRPFISKKA